jgi:hypothetical protein
VNWYIRKANDYLKRVGSKTYTRTIKNAAQIIAEELTDKKDVQELIVEGIERARGEEK